MNIEQLLEDLRQHLLKSARRFNPDVDLLFLCNIALHEQADLLRRAEMSVENCDMYREREASVPDALRATPVAQDEVSKLREREAFNSGYDAICRRSITNREIASRMFQAGAEWQRSQGAPAGYRMVPVELLTDLRDSANECYNVEATSRYKDERRIAIYAEQVRQADELLERTYNSERGVSGVVYRDGRHYIRKYVDNKWTEWRLKQIAQPEPVSVPCSTHPDAPHGFNRNASHSLDRYVCDCEGWVAPEPVGEEVEVAGYILLGDMEGGEWEENDFEPDTKAFERLQEAMYNGAPQRVPVMTVTQHQRLLEEAKHGQRVLVMELEQLRAQLSAQTVVLPEWLISREALAQRMKAAGWRDLADAQWDGAREMVDEVAHLNKGAKS